MLGDNYKEVGYYWCKGFMAHHSNLQIRRPEALSLARAMCMNKVLSDKWFQDYEELKPCPKLDDCYGAMARAQCVTPPSQCR
jgi:hypothetical protein